MHGTFPQIDTPAPDTPQAAATRLREILRSTLPLCRELVAECCRAERVDQRLATLLEDFGQDFVGLSYPINTAAYAQEDARRTKRKGPKSMLTAEL